MSRHNGSERASGEDSERITSTRGANKRVVKVLAAGNMQRGLPSDFGLFTEKTEGFAILMLMPKHSSHVLDLAKRGAAIRLGELADEAKLLLGLFPHLRDSFDRDEMPISFLIAQGSGQMTEGDVVERRRKRKVSAAARKAMSEAQKKRWAAQRAG